MTDSQEVAASSARSHEILSAVDAQREASAVLVDQIAEDFDGGLRELILLIAAAIRTQRPSLLVQRVGQQTSKRPEYISPLSDKPL